MIRLFLAFLFLWSAFSMVFITIAIADLMFGGPKNKFFSRLILAPFWPIAILSARGRNRLFGVYSGIN